MYSKFASLIACQAHIAAHRFYGRDDTITDRIELRLVDTILANAQFERARSCLKSDSIAIDMCRDSIIATWLWAIERETRRYDFA